MRRLTPNTRTLRAWPICNVCGRLATYEHEGALYCARNPCQLVAAGMREKGAKC